MLLDAIRTQFDALSKSERKVAAAVLDNPELTLAENITALAKSAQVSEPTVVRFCRAVGCDGWHEFKLKLAQGLALSPTGSDETPLQEPYSCTFPSAQGPVPVAIDTQPTQFRQAFLTHVARQLTYYFAMYPHSEQRLVEPMF